MKIAPIAAALRSDGRVQGAILHTGQHYDREMSDLFFEQLDIPEPVIRLGVGSGTHARQTGELMIRLEPVLVERKPDAVLVVGDVNSTMAAALVAVKLGLPVIHVEAGLRSFDRTMPEEINRLVTDAVSSWLFVSEPSGVDNLHREGIDADKVHFVGNVMIDTLLRFRDRAASLRAPAKFGLEPGCFAVATLHRPANVDDPRTLSAILQPLLELGERLPVVFAVHPRTRRMLRELGIDGGERLRAVDAMGYLEFLGLMIDARLVVTDSGGIQEETTVLGVPCVTVRDNTERPITVTQGTNRLAGTRPDGIRRSLEEALAHTGAPRIPPLWDGRAAERIVAVLAGALG